VFGVVPDHDTVRVRVDCLDAMACRAHGMGIAVKRCPYSIRHGVGWGCASQVSYIRINKGPKELLGWRHLNQSNSREFPSVSVLALAPITTTSRSFTVRPSSDIEFQQLVSEP
jgi:hypothetical protein